MLIDSGLLHTPTLITQVKNFVLVIGIAIQGAAVIIQGVGSAATIVLQGQRQQIIAILEG